MDVDIDIGGQKCKTKAKPTSGPLGSDSVLRTPGVPPICGPLSSEGRELVL